MQICVAAMRVEQLISLWVWSSKWKRNWLHCLFILLEKVIEMFGNLIFLSSICLCRNVSGKTCMCKINVEVFILYFGRETITPTELWISWTVILRETKWLYDCDKFVKKRQGNGYKCRCRNNKIRDDDNDVSEKGYFHYMVLLRARIAKYMSRARQGRM